VKKIYESGIKEYIDIESRINGFIAHISIFLKEVTVLDIRPNIYRLFYIEFKNVMQQISLVFPIIVLSQYLPFMQLNILD